MTDHGRLLRLRLRSVFDVLDLVQVVTDHVARMASLDDDAVHWIGVAVRESVINAIKHGNRQDAEKLVTVEFEFRPGHSPTELVVTIQDEGEGFEPEEVANPLAPENLLKSSGRGIFFMRSFMDDVVLRRIPEGGMEVKLVKRLTAPVAFNSPPVTAPLDPALASTAVEAVLKAGDIQMARFGRGVQITKKGDIDLVTEVDVAVERMFRTLVAERFPDHDVLGEEFGDSLKGSSHCWIFDPLDGTTNFAHGLPIFCASLGLEVDGEVRVAAVYDPTRRELFTAEAGRGAFLNGEPLRVSTASRLIDSMLCTGFPYDVHRDRADIIGLFDAFVGRARAVRRLGSAALDLCYVAAGRLDGFWEQRLKPWDTCAGALVVAEAGGRVTGWRGERYQPRDDRLLASNGSIHGELLEVIAAFEANRSKEGTR